jgi:hypothetical protein
MTFVAFGLFETVILCLLCSDLCDICPLIAEQYPRLTEGLHFSGALQHPQVHYTDMYLHPDLIPKDSRNLNVFWAVCQLFLYLLFFFRWYVQYIHTSFYSSTFAEDPLYSS